MCRWANTVRANTVHIGGVDLDSRLVRAAGRGRAGQRGPLHFLAASPARGPSATSNDS